MNGSDAHRTRSVRKTLSFTPEEWAVVERRMELASARSFEKFARRAVLEARIEVARVAFDPRPMRLELSRIGNNVNQIARAVNIDDAVSVEQLRETRRLLGIIQKTIDQAAKAR